MSLLQKKSSLKIFFYTSLILSCQDKLFQFFHTCTVITLFKNPFKDWNTSSHTENILKIFFNCHYLGELKKSLTYERFFGLFDGQNITQFCKVVIL